MEYDQSYIESQVICGIYWYIRLDSFIIQNLKNQHQKKLIFLLTVKFLC